MAIMSSKILLLVTIAIVGVIVTNGSSIKIDVKLAKAMQKNPAGSWDIFVSFSGIQGPLKRVNAEFVRKGIRDRTAKATQIYNVLVQHAQESQEKAKETALWSGLKENQFQSFWITNQLYIKGASEALIQSLASLSSVQMIEIEGVSQLKRPIIEDEPHQRNGVLAEWNVEKMRVHMVWDAPWGNNGTGVVVGFIDTGVRGTHEAIREQYRNDGKSWRDPYNQYSVPTDVYNHGTHTVGSVVGSFGIGMAPGAKWIACKGYADDGSALMSAFAECGQFMVCPTDQNGQNPDCSLTPHVTSNSWGVWPGTDFFEDVLDVWHSVGMIGFFSNGNEGPSCSNMIAPADSTKALGIGATGLSDDIASWSSRGPSPRGNNILKPDISAPGVGIRSCDCRSDTGYVSMSGTSMSCPNAAGVGALMVGRKRTISYQEVKSLLESTAVRSSVVNGESCGGITDSQWPNNKYGHGRIDAYDAIQGITV